MKIVIACCKTWFEVDKLVTDMNDVLILREKEDLTLSALSAFNPEFVFFPHWNWIVPTEIHENFECVVFHTAPLPYGRGGTPIQNLILRGFSHSPVCALKMTSVVDGGPIYAKVDIALEGRLVDIFTRMNQAVNTLISDILETRPEPKSQNGDVYEFNRLIADDNQIPENLSLTELYDRIRMLDDDSYPNSFLLTESYKLEFFNVYKNDESIDCQVRLTLNDKQQTA